MTDMEPMAVAVTVEDFIDEAVHKVEQDGGQPQNVKFDVAELHAMGAQIYALGYVEGRRVERERQSRRRMREKGQDAARSTG